MSEINLPPSTRSESFLVSTGRRLKHAAGVIVHHGKKHIGVGIICSVAYFDPGNWGVDLQAGSQFGYHLLFVVLLAGIFAVYLQVLASRLGCVTGIDLACHTRLLLYNRPKHTLLYRWMVLYPLYVLAEVAIIATDLAELLGSAIALCMLFPKLELWQGVLITAFDVILILGMRDPLRGKPVRMFELLIGVLVIAVLVCMVVIISKVNVDWAKAFEGYLPSKAMFAQGGVYTSVGVLGSTVMPHILFLGSALATQDRVSFREDQDRDDGGLSALSPSSKESLPIAEPIVRQSVFRRIYNECKDSVLNAFRTPPVNIYTAAATRHSEWLNNPYEFVRAHIYHGTLDIVGSLLGFAVMINSLILMLSSAVFFYGNGGNKSSANPASLFDAYDLIRDDVGQPAATLFAIALLASGQSSSLIATVAGQAVCEGFLQWRVSPVVRRLFTRLLAIVPSMTVAIILGRAGINSLLVVSQVVLSIVLPFIIFPLIYCTSNKSIMSVRKTLMNTRKRPIGGQPGTVVVVELPISLEDRNMPKPVAELESGGGGLGELVDYSNSKLMAGLGWALWLMVVAANMYAIVELGLGTGQ